MENNYNENKESNQAAGSMGGAADNANAEYGGNMENGHTADGGSGAQESGVYGYSYVNQEQKNPNNVWRANENTASGNTAYQNTAYQNTTGQNASYQNSGYGQNAYNASYGSIYGNHEQQAGKKKEKRVRPNGKFGIKIAKCASIALVFGLVGGTAFEGSTYLMGKALGTDDKKTAVEDVQETTPKEDAVLSTTDTSKKTASAASAAATDVSAVVEECMPSIVAITNMSERQIQNWFGQVQNYESQSAGSGIIVSEDEDYLYIATNNHVVESATTLTIQFCDETTAAAEVKGTDKSSDLAVVKVKKSDIEAETLKTIKVASLGDSDALQVGSQAIAIGNALGYGQSVTTGVISAVEREVSIQDETTGETLTSDLIQTDAAINPGNSGGALLNSDGEVIGINSSKYSDTDVEGMGFAIPINTAKTIVEDLIVREVVSEDKAAYLGIVGVDVTSDVSDSFGIPEGVSIAKVSNGTPADKAGLRQGDVIVKFDGKEVKSMESLTNMLQYYEAGTDVDLVIMRSGENGYEEQTVTVTLGKKNS